MGRPRIAGLALLEARCQPCRGVAIRTAMPLTKSSGGRLLRLVGLLESLDCVCCGRPPALATFSLFDGHRREVFA